MADGISLKLKGMDVLQKRLTKMGKRLGGNALRSATNKAMTPVLKQARATIKRGDRAHKTYKGRQVFGGFASRNVIKKSSSSRDKTFARTAVGVKSEAFYAVSFLERGTSKQPAQPWLKPAFVSQKDLVLTNFTKLLRQEVEKRGG